VLKAFWEADMKTILLLALFSVTVGIAAELGDVKCIDGKPKYYNPDGDWITFSKIQIEKIKAEKKKDEFRYIGQGTCFWYIDNFGKTKSEKVFADESAPTSKEAFNNCYQSLDKKCAALCRGTGRQCSFYNDVYCKDAKN
jgi:hypothetical protein